MSDENKNLYIIKPRWLEIAEKEIGIKEISGSNKNNPRILEYHKTTNLGASDDETPWCSSFVNWCITKSGHKGTNLSNAQSWLSWGQSIRVPAYGCAIVLSRGSKSWQGHVGFCVREDENKFFILGGNQNNQVSIQPFPKSSLLGLRWI